MNKWVYLSHMISTSTPCYGGRADIEINHDRCISNGDSCNQLNISFKNHVSTHIDLPFHFDPLGKKLQDYDANFWLFHNVEVVECPMKKNELIFPSHLTVKNQEVEFLLLKTGFEKIRNEKAYWECNPGLTPELGDFLKANFKKLKVIGFDFISATAYQHRSVGKLAHQSFLGNGNGTPILLIEDMKLVDISKNSTIEYLDVAPLLIESADGVPVTVKAKLGR